MTERRRYQRTPAVEPITIYFVTNTLETTAGHTIDVGAGGCALELDDPCPGLTVGKQVLAATDHATTLGRIVATDRRDVRIEFTPGVTTLSRADRGRAP